MRREKEILRAHVESCRAILEAGSKSFATSAQLLPPRVRDSATVLYAFCRVADDLIDGDPAASAATVDLLRGRLERIYRGEPDAHPVDRALCEVVRRHAIPMSTFEALLEGLTWDAEGRRYESMEALADYCARVAGTVGVMMTMLMGRRDPAILARACDLGVAMQLTNIARDVGEDARRGHIYLPLAWLRQADIDTEQFLLHPCTGRKLAGIIQRLLREADRLYQQADAGITMLPADCRVSIRAARFIYADIGRAIERAGFDSVSRRAVVPSWRKMALLLKAIAGERAGAPGDAMALHAPPLEATRFLITGALGVPA